MHQIPATKTRESKRRNPFFEPRVSVRFLKENMTIEPQISPHIV